MLRALGLSLFLLTGACTLGPDRGEAPVSPLAAEEIEVVPLDAPAATPAAAAGTTAPDSQASVPATAAAAPETAPAPEPEAAPAAPARPPSPEALACERRGGAFVTRGGGSLGSCQIPTRDGQRSCRRGSDCEGECLARSGTCAPVRPLFGCNEVLDDLGRRMTQCLQ